MRLILSVLLLSVFGLCSTEANDSNDTFTLYLVRHAEKEADGSRDPALTEAGKNRSQKLSNLFLDRDINDVWSSDYIRTRETVRLLAVQLGLTIKIYDPGNQTELVRQLLDRQRNALVVGHSNTIPELARLLCGCAIADMGESEHDRLIVISIVNGEVSTDTLDQRSLFNQ